MRKKIISSLFILLSSLFFAGCSLRPQPAGLDVNSTPVAKVFIDNKEVGTTPFNLQRKAGEISLKLVPESGSPWESTVKLVSGVSTVVRRELGPTDAQSSGEVYLFEKGTKDKASLAVVSTPDAITVRLDGQPKGFTPLLVDDLSEGEHQIVLTSPGFKDKAIGAKAKKGFKLSLNVKLAQDFAQVTPTPLPTDISGTPTPTSNLTPTSKLSPTPTSRLTGSPTPRPTGPTPTSVPRPYIEILDTPTGFLRVRSDAGVNFSEVAQVKPGEKYSYIGSKEDSDGTAWYQIEYSSAKKGYVISTYAKKVE